MKLPSAKLPIMGIASATIIFFILTPIVTILYQSFLRPQSYLDVIADPAFRAVFANTLILVFCGLPLALILGTLLAFIIVKTDVAFKSALEILVISPMFISPLIGAMAWSLLIGPAGIITVIWESFFGAVPWKLYSLPGMIILSGLYSTPFVYLFVSASLRAMNPELEESSRVSGAGVIRTVLNVTIPLMRPAIAFTGILVFITMFEEFSIPLIIGYPAGVKVITTYLYELNLFYPPPYASMAVISVVTLSITVFLIFIQRILVGRQERFITVTGKVFRPPIINLGLFRQLAFIFCIGYVNLVIFLPLIGIIFRSFLRYWSVGVNPFELFTLINYSIVIRRPMASRAIQNSIILSVSGAFICILLTSIAAYIIYREKIRSKVILDYVSQLPVAVPGVILAIGFLWTWLNIRIGIYGTIWILLVAYITRYIPFGLRNVSASLLQNSPEFDECSRICGASWLKTFIKIIIPLIRHGMMSGWVLLFMSIMKETNTSILLYSPGTEVMSVLLIDLWEWGDFGDMSAFSVILISVIFVVVLIFRKIFKVKLYPS